MLHIWDTVLETIPADQSKQLSKRILNEIAEQGDVYSLHPQCPEDVTYVGTRLGRYGEAYDYYQDERGIYWYDSRKELEPVVTKFRYRGKPCRKYTVSAPAADRKHLSA